MERKISATAALRSARTPYRKKEDNLIGPSEKRDRKRINITQACVVHILTEKPIFKLFLKNYLTYYTKKSN